MPFDKLRDHHPKWFPISKQNPSAFAIRYSIVLHSIPLAPCSLLPAFSPHNSNISRIHHHNSIYKFNLCYINKNTGIYFSGFVKSIPAFCQIIRKKIYCIVHNGSPPVVHLEFLYPGNLLWINRNTKLIVSTVIIWREGCWNVNPAVLRDSEL